MRKVLLFIAAGCLIAGVILFVCVSASINFDFMEFASMQFVTNNYEVEEYFESISVETITADVEVRLAKDGRCRVVCYEKEKLTHSVDVKDGVLFITESDQRNILDHIKGGLFSVGTPSVTVYIPDRDYSLLKVDNTTGNVELNGKFGFNELDIQTTTGDITLNNVFCRGNVSLQVTTGDIVLDQVYCRYLAALGATGDAVLKNVIAENTMRIKCTTGDIKLERCDASTLYLNATTGDITGTLLTAKDFSASATTGEVNVPDSNGGGRCEISVTTGDIRIKID